MEMLLIPYLSLSHGNLGTVAAPVISTVARTGTIQAGVTFTIPPSEQNADHFEVRYYANTGSSNSFTDIAVSPLQKVVCTPCSYSIILKTFDFLLLFSGRSSWHFHRT